MPYDAIHLQQKKVSFKDVEGHSSETQKSKKAKTGLKKDVDMKQVLQQRTLKDVSPSAKELKGHKSFSK